MTKQLMTNSIFIEACNVMREECYARKTGPIAFGLFYRPMVQPKCFYYIDDLDSITDTVMIRGPIPHNDNIL